MSFASAVIDYVSAHPQLAYAMAFLLALSEAVPIVGAVVPGSALIIGIAALVPIGAVKLWPLITVAFLGAVVGDGFSYWLGHRYHDAIMGRWPLKRFAGHVQRSEAFLQRHGGKSVFFARFVPAVRAFVPLVAGVLRMPMRRFYVANVLSALVWAPAHILPGVLAGASFTLAGPAAGRLAALIVVLLVVLWLIVWIVRLALRHCVPFLAAVQEHLWRWANAKDTWLSRHVRAVVDPERAEIRVLTVWAVVVLGAAWTFFGILEDVVTGDPLVRVDAAVYRALQHLRTPLGDAVMIAITEMGDTAVTSTVTVVVLLWLIWQRAWRTAAYWAAAVGFAAALNTGIKLAVHRARPGDFAYYGATEFSFPSGHATINAVMYGFLVFVIARQLRPVWRLPIVAAVIGFTAMIAVSRLYLGAHWFSDVAGSLAFAVAWLIVLAVVYVRHRAPDINVKGLSAVACSALVLTGGFNIYRHHAADTQRYAVHYDIPTLNSAEWGTTTWKQLPAYRVDLTGELEEPLTFQWAGSLQALEDRLVKNSWHRPAPWTFQNAIEWLATTDALKLPAIPHLQGGRMPSLTMIRSQEAGQSPASRTVLRLWSADVDLKNGSTAPLWVGSVVEERMSRVLFLITMPVSNPDADGPRASLAQAVGDGRLVQRSAQEFEGKWDGRVLLAREAEAPADQPSTQQDNPAAAPYERRSQ